MGRDTPAGLRHLTESRAALVAAIRQGAVTADALAQRLGISPSAVRAQLGVLERDGWVVAVGALRDGGVGKPATSYRVSDEAERQLSAAYQPLLVALVTALAGKLEPKSRVRLYREVGRRLAAGILDGRPRIDVESAVGILEGLGAVITREEAGPAETLLRGSGCPIAEAVRGEPVACESLASLVGGLTGRRTVTVCEHHPRPRCRFRVEKEVGGRPGRR